MTTKHFSFSAQVDPVGTKTSHSFNDLQMTTALFKYTLLQAERSSLARNDNFKKAIATAKQTYLPDIEHLKKILKERGEQLQNPGEIERVIARQLVSLNPIEENQQTLFQESHQEKGSSNPNNHARENGISSIQSGCPQSKGTFAEQTQKLIENINNVMSVFSNGMRESQVDQDLSPLLLKESHSLKRNWVSSSQTSSSTPAGIPSRDRSLLLAGAALKSDDEMSGEPLGISKLISKRKRKHLEFASEKENSAALRTSSSSISSSKEDTKNLLKNFGNAQQRFVLNSAAARKYIENRLSPEKSEEFKKWVQQLRLDNFEQFKNAWFIPENEGKDSDVDCEEEDGGGSIVKEFKIIYRELCFDFYENHASVYVLSSQMRQEHTRKTHIKYISRFLDGIVNPSTFYYFKKS